MDNNERKSVRLLYQINVDETRVGLGKTAGRLKPCEWTSF